MNFIEKISPKAWKWMEKNPKRFLKNALVGIVLSLMLSTVIEVYFPYKNPKLLTPHLFSKSQSVHQNISHKTKQMNAIISELKSFQKKQQESTLNQEDSLRILFLNKQYKTLKNEY